ncbi:hypothetical protein LTR97_005266 [Elasticomyces elasticus]|uniref:Uncharacterized protein n=1 Tax=Elasticomyces elasticus TaxID=574655 RepID=A0AAN7W5P4_9PEZI|nr:hypothetical protein LTR97_005266 [Elasticomyces elasticus]
MDTQVWTAEDIRQGRCIEAIYLFVSIVLFVLAVPLILIHTLAWHYNRRLNRVYLFFLPSVYPICILAAFLVPEFFSHIGIYLPIFGMRIGIPPVLPSSCEATRAIGIHNTFPCRVESVLGWLYLASSGSSWNEIWTGRATVYTSLTILAILALIALGLWCTTGTFWKHKCEGCDQVEGRLHFGSEKTLFDESIWCRRCRGLDEFPPFWPPRRRWEGEELEEGTDAKV